MNNVCLYTIDRHSEAVYSVAFSPNNEFLASGSFDQSLGIWSMKDGSLIRSYKGGGGIFEITWNTEGDKAAACFSNGKVSIFYISFF